MLQPAEQKRELGSFLSWAKLAPRNQATVSQARSMHLHHVWLIGSFQPGHMKNPIGCMHLWQHMHANSFDRRVPANLHARSPSRETPDFPFSREPGPGTPFASDQPGPTRGPDNQSCRACTPLAWPAHIRVTNQTLNFNCSICLPQGATDY